MGLLSVPPLASFSNNHNLWLLSEAPEQLCRGPTGKQGLLGACFVTIQKNNLVIIAVASTTSVIPAWPLPFPLPFRVP